MSNTCLIIGVKRDTFAPMMSESTQTNVGGSGLTERQRTILDVIRASVTTRGYPRASGRSVTQSVSPRRHPVAHQLRTLERKAILRRGPNRPRARSTCCRRRRRSSGGHRSGRLRCPAEPTFVPVLGRIAASGPILAGEASRDVFPCARTRRRGRALPAEVVGGDRWSTPRSATATGWSSSAEHADNGDIVAAMIDGRNHRQTSSNGPPAGVADAARHSIRSRQRRRDPGQGRHRDPQDLTAEPNSRVVPRPLLPAIFTRAFTSMVDRVPTGEPHLGNECSRPQGRIRGVHSPSGLPLITIPSGPGTGQPAGDGSRDATAPRRALRRFLDGDFSWTSRPPGDIYVVVDLRLVGGMTAPRRGVLVEIQPPHRWRYRRACGVPASTRTGFSLPVAGVEPAVALRKS